MDYLLEKHSPYTLRTLLPLKDLEFLKAILKVDGPAQHTRLHSRRCFFLGNDKDDFQEGPLGCNDNEAGPSSTTNDIV
jgi:hypothetical protein